MAAPAGIPRPRLNLPCSSMNATVPITIADIPHTICNRTSTGNGRSHSGVFVQVTCLLQRAELTFIEIILKANGKLASAHRAICVLKWNWRKTENTLLTYHWGCFSFLYLRSSSNTHSLQYTTITFFKPLQITNLTHNSFLYICLFQFSTCFEQASAHHQKSQLYQYDLWCMSLYVGDRVVCRLKIPYHTVTSRHGHFPPT